MAQYEFGIASLLNKKELLQIGDPVQFQVHITEDFAVNIQATREKLRSNVEAMKGRENTMVLLTDPIVIRNKMQILALFKPLHPICNN